MYLHFFLICLCFIANNFLNASNIRTIEQSQALTDNLFKAIDEGNTDLVTSILQSGADPNTLNDKGEAPLHKAISLDNDEIVSLLLTSGANPVMKAMAPIRTSNESEQQIPGLETPLHTAIKSLWKNKGIKIIGLLLHRCKSASIMTDIENYEGNTPLSEAAFYGYVPLVEFMIAEKHNPNSKNMNGDTPLMRVINTELVSDLDQDVPDKEKHRFIAKKRANLAKSCELVVKALLEGGANPNLKDELGNTALHFAMQNNYYYDVSTLLINYDADVGTQNDAGVTPLHIATRKGHRPLIQLLLDNHAPVNIPNNNGETPLMYATHHGDVSSVKLLLEKDATINDYANDKWTALHYAAETTNIKLIELLITYGADRTAQNDRGETPLHVACRFPTAPEIIELFAKRMDVNFQDGDGDTALHTATKEGHDDIVIALICVQANTAIKNNYGETPLDVAKARHHNSLIKLFNNLSHLKSQICTVDAVKALHEYKESSGVLKTGIVIGTVAAACLGFCWWRQNAPSPHRHLA